MFIKNKSLKKRKQKEKNHKTIGNIKKYCIFAPLFKKKFSDGREKGDGNTKRGPVTINPM